MTKLLIIRGLPGSGKSTLAAEMAPNACFEADTYMVDASGDYEFDPSRLAEVHEKCFQAVREALVMGTPVVAVANTFTRTWEFAKYIDLAQELGADHEVIVCTGSYNNVHGVSPEMVQRMRERWEA
jgi:predicted kinase